MKPGEHVSLMNVDLFPKNSQITKRPLRVQARSLNTTTIDQGVVSTEVDANFVLVSYEIKKWDCFGNTSVSLSYLAAESTYINDTNTQQETKKIKDLHIRLQQAIKAKNLDLTSNQELLSKIEENIEHLLNFKKTEYSANPGLKIEYKCGAVVDNGVLATGVRIITLNGVDIYESGGKVDIDIELTLVQVPLESEYKKLLQYLTAMLNSLNNSINI